ncbi:MAG: hypothetical protein ACI82Z_001585 [Cellvibrionaceae bacterium]|jgi:hypothetical protein
MVDRAKDGPNWMGRPGALPALSRKALKGQ